jgi:hypothetical protein
MTPHMIEILKLIASSADEQQAALPDFVVVADEIALLFDDELRLIDTNACGPDVRAGLSSIDERLTGMSDDTSLWTPNALTSASEWAALRNAASRLLAALGVAVSKPDLSWVTYQPANT